MLLDRPASPEAVIAELGRFEEVVARCGRRRPGAGSSTRHHLGRAAPRRAPGAEAQRPRDRRQRTRRMPNRGPALGAPTAAASPGTTSAGQHRLRRRQPSGETVGVEEIVPADSTAWPWRREPPCRSEASCPLAPSEWRRFVPVVHHLMPDRGRPDDVVGCHRSFGHDAVFSKSR